MRFMKNWFSMFFAVASLLGFGTCIIASLVWLATDGTPIALGLAALIGSVAAFSATWYALERS